MNYIKQYTQKRKAEKRTAIKIKVIKTIKIIIWIALFIAFYAIASNGTYPY
jgi:hypothetical protein